MNRSMVFLGLLLLAPTVALAAGDGHHAGTIWDLKFYLLNFAIYAYILWRVLKAPVAKALSGRRAGLEKAIRGATEKFDAVQTQLKSVQARFSQIEGEVNTIKSQLVDEGQAEAKRLVDDARRKAQRIKVQAERMAEAERRSTVTQLRRELAESVIAKARDEISGKMSAGRDAELRGAVAREAGSLLQ